MMMVNTAVRKKRAVCPFIVLAPGTQQVKTKFEAELSSLMTLVLVFTGDNIHLIKILQTLSNDLHTLQQILLRDD